jgi:chromate transporter
MALSLREIFDIFATYFKIGAFSFGGGYAMLPLMQKEIVEQHQWVSEEDFLGMLAVASSAPGSIAVNSAVFIGYKTWGVLGVVLSSVGIALPSFLIILAFALILPGLRENPIVEGVFNGIRPAAIALIATSVYKLTHSLGLRVQVVLIALASFVAIVWLDVHPIIVVAIAAFVGIGWGLIRNEPETPPLPLSEVEEEKKKATSQQGVKDHAAAP